MGKGQMTKRVIISKPDNLCGKMGTLNGDRFKYPGQSFWVQPVLLDDGSNVLCTSYGECMEPQPIRLSVDPSQVYDYQNLLTLGCCHHCGKRLEWHLEGMLGPQKNDDRFCYAECCATRFSMVPDQVRVIATLAVPEEAEEKEAAELMMDDDPWSVN